MPVSSTKLRKAEKCFTKQDFLDGKCTKEGFPISGSDKKTKRSPEPILADPTPAAEASATIVDNATVTSGPDATVDLNVESDNGDITDSPKSEDDIDRGDSERQASDQETT